MKRFTISRAAKAANVNVETVRFYERRGLIDQPPKPAGGGMREYDCDAVDRTARVLRDSGEVEVTLAEVVAGNRVRIRPGERLPVDGEVASTEEALVLSVACGG